MKKSILPGLALLALLLAFTGDSISLFGLVGLPVKSKAAKEFIKNSGEHTTYKSSDTYYYMFNEKGFDLMMTNDDTIAAVFVYAEGADDHKQYLGSIPHGLSLQMSRQEVEKLLGVPSVTGGSGVISFYASWDSIGVGVTYESLDTLDMMNKIHHIAFSRKDQ